MSVIGNPQIGALALIAGGAGLWAFWGQGDGTGVTAAGAIALGGGVQGLVGLALWQRQRSAARQDQAPHRSALDIDILVRSMVLVAAADGRFAAEEIAMIEDVSAGLLGESIPRSRIERIYGQMQGKKAIEQIARKARQITPEGSELALKGAVWAGRADGALTARETDCIAAVAAALGLSGHRARQCIAEAEHVHDRLTARGASGRGA